MSLLELCLKENGIAQQQIASFNRFLERGMQEIIDSVGSVTPNVPGYRLKFGRVWIEKPSIIEADSATRAILPAEARARNLTYAAKVFCEITPVINDIERKTSVCYIGDLPIMVRSRGCYTHEMSRAELAHAGEDPADPGGYFIINGTERVLVGIEDLATNKIFTTRENGGVTARIFSTRAGFRTRCVLTRNNEGLWFLDFPAAPPRIPLALLLRALGVRSSEAMVKLFDGDKLATADALVNAEGVEGMSTADAIDAIGKRAAPGQPREYRERRVEILMDTYLLPHIGLKPEARGAKALFLARMAARTSALAARRMLPDDKDHYSNKRIKLSGVLMEELFRFAFQFLTRDIAYQAERAAVRGRRLVDVQILVRPDTLSERIRYAMATGNWVGGQVGVCQMLDRTSFAATISHLRRIISPLARKHPHFEARDLHGTHFGRLCPNETPEGAAAGLVKNLALAAQVTIGVDEKDVEAVLRRMGVRAA